MTGTVLPDPAFHQFAAEESEFVHAFSFQQIRMQRSFPCSPEPGGKRNAESAFAHRVETFRITAAEGVGKNPLATHSQHLERFRKRHRKFNNRTVQKRSADLQRHRHGSPVRFDQNVIRQIVPEIELLRRTDWRV